MDRYVNLKINDMGTDGQGRLVLVINCRCVLPHATSEAYRASHADGCLYRPSEGIVFDIDGERVTGWSCHDVYDRELVAVPAEKKADVIRQYHEIMEADRKKAKRRKKEAW